MPGNPKYRAFLIRMSERFATDRGFMEWVANGGQIPELAREMGVSKDLIYKWVRKDERRHELFKEARKLCATVLADEALDIADHATPLDGPVAKEKIKIRQWLAERFDRESYGHQTIATNVHMTIGEMHLEAFRGPPKELPPSDVEDAEFEVVDELGSQMFRGLDAVMEETHAPEEQETSESNVRGSGGEEYEGDTEVGGGGIHEGDEEGIDEEAAREEEVA